LARQLMRFRAFPEDRLDIAITACFRHFTTFFDWEVNLLEAGEFSHQW